MSVDFSHDRVIRLTTSLLWQYFYDYIKKFTKEEIDLETAIKNDLKSAKFADDSIQSIWNVYANNRIGENILDELSMEEVYKVTGYCLWLEKPNYNKYDLLARLREYGIDSITKDCEKLLAAYESYLK